MADMHLSDKTQKELFEKARLSALRLPGCSAAFVSEDGLVMTNHLCARGALDAVNREGENLPETGFYAATLEEEEKYQIIMLINLFILGMSLMKFNKRLKRVKLTLKE